LTIGALELAVDPLVSILFGRPFVAAVPVARVLLVGALFFSARRILAEGLKGAGYPAAGTVAEIVSLIVIFGALIPLIQVFGLVGAAAAVTISGAAGLGVLLWLASIQLRLVSTPPLTVAEQRATEQERAS
jgi:O-antigen/teichoic acid export membrane protein